MFTSSSTKPLFVWLYLLSCDNVATLHFQWNILVFLSCQIHVVFVHSHTSLYKSELLVNYINFSLPVYSHSLTISSINHCALAHSACYLPSQWQQDRIALEGTCYVGGIQGCAVFLGILSA